MKARGGIALCSLLLGFLLGATPVFAQTSLQKRVNRGVVSLMAGDINSTNLRFASDLADLLDGEDLRVLPIVGKGSIKNLEDLLYMDGIDVAMVQSDVLASLKRNGRYGALQKKLRYITKLYNEELHLLARADIATLADLNDQEVDFGHQYSGASITAGNVFNALKINVKPVFLNHNAALTKLRRGEIAAIAYVAGKPANLFSTLKQDAGLHFLSIEHDPALLETYLPARLSHTDYPNLIADGEEMSTIAVGTLMAVYNWRSNRPRYRRVARFVERFFASVATLQREPGHPKWQEVSLPAIVPGWQRFSAAENWLRRDGTAAAKKPDPDSPPTTQ